VFTPSDAYTNSSGNYVATIPNPGEYAVSVSTMRGSHFEAGSVSVTATTTHDIDMRGSSVRGRVIDAATGEPVPGADVSAVRQQSRGPMGGPPVTTDADGRFVFDPVSAGSYVLRVHKSRYAPVSRTLEVADTGANDVEIRLERGEAVAVRVLDAITGKPVEGASINVRDSANKPVFGGAPPRDDNGVITIALSPGQYVALVSAPQYPSQSAAFSVPGPELVIRLMRGGRLAIEGRVEGASSLRIVSLAGPANLRGPAPPFRFENVAPGTYRLEILGPNGTVLVTKTVTITSDATTTVTVP
jgi:5-hydroxyisourate hydrolase-like protein (transthyretin family)